MAWGTSESPLELKAKSTDIVKIFKGLTGLRMSRKFLDLESKLWRGVTWSPSYYVGTAGHV
jgi:putative transposase